MFLLTNLVRHWPLAFGDWLSANHNKGLNINGLIYIQAVFFTMVREGFLPADWQAGWFVVLPKAKKLTLFFQMVWVLNNLKKKYLEALQPIYVSGRPKTKNQKPSRTIQLL